jgi:hypothetical protein
VPVIALPLDHQNLLAGAEVAENAGLGEISDEELLAELAGAAAARS